MKKIIFIAFFLAIAASSGLAFPSVGSPLSPRNPIHPATKGLPPEPATKGLPPVPATKGLPPVPATKGLPPEPATKGLPPTTLSDTPLGQVLAQSGTPISGISQGCATALLGIVTSPEFLKCMPVQAFIPLLPIVADPTIIAKVIADPKKNYGLIENPLIQFSEAFCPAPKCSDKGVSDAVKTIQDKCKDDIQKVPLVGIIFDLAVFYSPLHDSVCFKTGKKQPEFCWDETALTVISLPPSPFKLIDGGIIDSIAVADPDAICTKCNKDMVNTFFNFLKDSDLKDLAKQILQSLKIDQKVLDGIHVGAAVKCGLGFIDGKVPDKP